MNYLEGKTLAERQMHYYNGFKCPYCDKETELVNSERVYGPGQDYGLMYVCFPCQAHVGTKSGTDQALGPLAKKTLRDLRHECHKFFYPLIDKKTDQGFSKISATRSAYKWLQQILNIQPEEAHIGYLNNEQCRKVIESCKAYIHGTVQNKALKESYVPTRRTEVNKMLIEGMEDDYAYKLYPISVTYFMLTHEKTRQQFRFNIETEVGKWERPNEQWKKIPDIEKFIKRHFKP